MPKCWDVCVVGAGPAGATFAYYASLAGLDVLLLERRRFPRDKLCGNAVAPPAQKHLRGMGVLQALEKEGHVGWVKSGGFVSPGGIEALGHADNRRGHVAVVKRTILDERIARAAQSAGATLIEDAQVESAALDQRARRWTIRARNETFEARVLVAADGAHSKLARALGVVHGPPNAICSRAYVEPNTHAFPYDGVGYLTKLLLPACAGIMKNAEGDLTFCCYVMPQSKTGVKDLEAVHHRVLEENPFVKRHLGPRYKIERMRGAWLRLGVVKRSVADQFVVIGDAAGHQDPITGDGIKLAMDGAMFAAETVREAFGAGDLSERFLTKYHNRCMMSFGHAFHVSRAAAEIALRMPWVLDAVASAAVRRGTVFLNAMMDVLGSGELIRPMMSPQIVLPVSRELARFALSRREPVH